MSTSMPIAYASIVMQGRRTADFYDFTSEVFDQDLTVERPGIQYFFLVLQFSTGACQFGSSFRQVIVDVDGRSAMLPVVSLSGRLVRGTPRHALCLMRTGRCTDAVGRLHAELRGGGFWRCPSVVGVVPASSRR